MDEIDQKIIKILLENSRLSLKQLAHQVGLSAPSTSERLRRLEERNIVVSYTLKINPWAFGYQLQAIVRIRPLPGQLQVVQKLIEETPAFCECDKVTGDDCYIVRLFVRSVEELDTILASVADNAQVHTSIVKSQPIARRPPPF